MKLENLLNEMASHNVLYHAIRDPKFALQALRNDKIEGRTTQRFWANGQRLKGDHPNYQNSFWLKGISTTRDRKFAENWGPVVLKLNKDLIARQYEIIPFNWGFANEGDNNHKREREEFIVCAKAKKTYNDYQKEWIEYYNNLTKQEKFSDNYIREHDWFSQPEGKPLEPLHKFILEIYLDKTILDYNSWQPTITAIKSHPKFKGYY